MSFGEACDLVAGLQREFGSQLFAAEAGWSFAAGYGELMTALQHHAFVQVHFENGGAAEVPFPWSVATGQEVVSAEERRVAEEYLARHTAIRN